jgi:hypothetical protein
MREYFPNTPQDPLYDLCPFCERPVLDLLRTAPEEVRDNRGGEISTSRAAICLRCGWNSAVSLCRSWDGGWISYMLRGMTASLQELGSQDISLHIYEVKRYLQAHYKDRFRIHPRLFEEVVASVFRDLGFEAVVTGYSNDGGLDIILERDGQRIGVQVKRYKHLIKIEQLRSLAGALVLAGLTRGIFVTTSGFQRGAAATRRRLAGRGYRVEFLNAQRFYEALGLGLKPWQPEQFHIDNLFAKARSLIHRGAPTPDCELYGFTAYTEYSSVYGDDGTV